MILYHGSDCRIPQPDILHSQSRLDFGKGFYLTSVKEQAERWAKRKAVVRSREKGVVSQYDFSLQPGFRILSFENDLEAWIDFVCECRNGADCYLQYDIIQGKVADDKVFRVVDMYKRGIWDRTRAIAEVRAYETYDQYAFITQKAIEAMLAFRGSYEVTV